jgi:two-component system response regulator HydG
VLMCAEELVGPEDLTVHLSTATGRDLFNQIPLEKLLSLAQIKDAYISHVIRQCKGNKAEAARILGIDVSTIHRRNIEPS